MHFKISFSGTVPFGFKDASFPVAWASSEHGGAPLWQLYCDGLQVKADCIYEGKHASSCRTRERVLPGSLWTTTISWME